MALSEKDQDCVPLKLGLKLSGPCLVLLYRDEVTSGLFSKPSTSFESPVRLRQRTMPVRNLSKASDCADLASRYKSGLGWLNRQDLHPSADISGFFSPIFAKLKAI